MFCNVAVPVPMALSCTSTQYLAPVDNPVTEHINENGTDRIVAAVVLASVNPAVQTVPVKAAPFAGYDEVCNPYLRSVDMPPDTALFFIAPDTVMNIIPFTLGCI